METLQNYILPFNRHNDYFVTFALQKVYIYV